MDEEENISSEDISSEKEYILVEEENISSEKEDISSEEEHDLVEEENISYEETNNDRLNNILNLTNLNLEKINLDTEIEIEENNELINDTINLYHIINKLNNLIDDE